MIEKPNVVLLSERKKAARMTKLHRALSSLQVERVAKRFGKIELYLGEQQIVNLGTAKNVLSYREAQAAIADVTGFVIKLPKGTKWEQVAQTIFDAIEVEEGFTYSEDDETRGWLERYCKGKLLRSSVNMLNAEDLFENLESQYKGFRDKQGNVYISLDYFIRFVGGEYYTRLTLREAVERLGRLGFERKQVAARQGDEIRRKRLWLSPKGFFDEKTED